jgi:glycosyltransferase involved in cell wall biosynthesis
MMIKNNEIRVLMVSTEYPPMKGGVGRHAANLTKELRKIGFTVIVACNEEGDGDFFGLAPTNDSNSEVLLKIVEKSAPDVVHVQFEHGLYGLSLDPFNPKNTHTNVDLFYEKCTVPIVTTFHTSFTFKQWMNMVVPIRNWDKFGRFGRYGNKLIRYWAHLINYNSFNDLNKQKLKRSREGIVFSQYMKDKVGGGKVVYHGAEPAVSIPYTKEMARSRFSLPKVGRIALSVGFRTATKGWDIFRKMDIPEPWTLVINSSKNHYNMENFSPVLNNQNKIVNLEMDFLNEAELSLLFYAADAVLLPYKVSSGSGVMFDALSHGIPFVASDLDFFKEFSAFGLGITAKRNAIEFERALRELNAKYDDYVTRVREFKDKLSWNNVAKIHGELYSEIATSTISERVRKEPKTISGE